jgi:gliding motility-associated protein GldL
MNIGDFLHSKRWKLIQNYIYSWGASIVLIGALFKLEHLPGASAFLGVGLSIEAIIFFISAFEPLMENPDWKKVYPQLRTGDESDRELAAFEEVDKLYGRTGGAPVVAAGVQVGATVSVPASSSVPSFGALPEEQIKILNDSLQKLTETAKGIKNLTEASAASDAFVKNLNEASQSIGKIVSSNEKVSAELEKGGKEITESYKSAAGKLIASTDKVSAEINQSVAELSGSYKNTAEAISNSGKKVSVEMEQSAQSFNTQLIASSETLKKSYKEMTDTLTGGFKSLDKNSGKYIENIEKLNKNLAALNAVYEIQLQGANKVESMVGEYSKGVTEVNKLIQKSIEETRKFNENTKEISENIQALNKVYGNMLGALNVKK